MGLLESLLPQEGISFAVLQAGVLAYWEGDDRFELDEEIVARIYRAMKAAADEEATGQGRAHCLENPPGRI